MTAAGMVSPKPCRPRRAAAQRDAWHGPVPCFRSRKHVLDCSPGRPGADPFEPGVETPGHLPHRGPRTPAGHGTPRQPGCHPERSRGVSPLVLVCVCSPFDVPCSPLRCPGRWFRSGGFSRLDPPQAGKGQGLWPGWNRPAHRFFLFSCGPPQAGRTRRRHTGVAATLTYPGPQGRGYTAGGFTAGGQGR
jgi:hypothetical protein